MPRCHVRDIELYYEIAGEGPPLLLLHGLGSSTRDWEHQLPHFAPHYQVINVDLRGHGRSDKPRGPYTVPIFADDVALLLRMLGCGPAHVVGLSLGGMIAFQLAVSAPELVRSLVIVNSSPFSLTRNWKERLTVMLLIATRWLVVRIWGMQKMGEIIAKGMLPGPENAEQRKVAAARWAENDKAAYLASVRALAGWSVRDRLPTIQCPTLVVAAEHDYLPLALKEEYVAQMPHAELTIIKGAHHFLPVEYPAEFNQVVGAFLARQEAAAPPQPVGT